MIIYVSISLGLVLNLFFFSLVHATNGSAFSIKESKNRCAYNEFDRKKVYKKDFKLFYNQNDMDYAFNELYFSEKRLDYHAYYDMKYDSFYLQYTYDKFTIPVKITENFIKSVTFHIETALKHGYANFVFFPDMGHAHLYFRQDHWNDQYATVDFSYKNMAKMYEKMLADTSMQPLYHLSEGLKMLNNNNEVLDDPSLSFKYWNRNFLGKNNGTSEYAIHIVPDVTRYNTVCSLKGYTNWSAGFAVSASQLGCFPYRDREGRIRYFDISLYDPCCHSSTYSFD